MSQVQACIEKKEEISSALRTGKIWILYIDMIRRVRNLIAGDRMGSWELHLQAVHECLPMFAATGHNNYLKSAYHYLQNMSRLHKTHPELHGKFIQRHHVLRRSDKLWAGISCDLAIEQTLMRSLKTSGGLTHGSIFGVGKKSAFQKLAQNNKTLIDAADVFSSQTSTVETIRKHGSSAMVALNGGKGTEDLSSLRNRLLEKATVGNTFNPS